MKALVQEQILLRRPAPFAIRLLTMALNMRKRKKRFRWWTVAELIALSLQNSINSNKMRTIFTWNSLKYFCFLSSCSWLYGISICIRFGVWSWHAGILPRIYCSYHHCRVYYTDRIAWQERHGHQEIKSLNLQDDLDYKELLPQDFNPSSRIWIYTAIVYSASARLCRLRFTECIRGEWKSHGTPVKDMEIFSLDNLLCWWQMIRQAESVVAAPIVPCGWSNKSNSNTKWIYLTAIACIYYQEKLQLIPLPQLNYAAEIILLLQIHYTLIICPDQRETPNNWIIPVKDSWLASRAQFKKEVIS